MRSDCRLVGSKIQKKQKHTVSKKKMLYNLKSAVSRLIREPFRQKLFIKLFKKLYKIIVSCVKHIPQKQLSFQNQVFPLVSLLTTDQSRLRRLKNLLFKVGFNHSTLSKTILDLRFFFTSALQKYKLKRASRSLTFVKVSNYSKKVFCVHIIRIKKNQFSTLKQGSVYLVAQTILLL